MKISTQCPYCHHAWTHDYSDEFPFDSGHEVDVDCPKCGKVFCAEITIEYSVWETAYEDEDEEEVEK